MKLQRPLASVVALFLFASGAVAQGPFATFDQASEATLNDPHDLTIGPDGRLYVADKFGNRIVILDPDTMEIVGTFGDGILQGVHDISFGPDGRAYVAVTNSNSVAVFDLSAGEPVLSSGYAGFSRSEGILAHSNGRIYVMASGTGNLMISDGADWRVGHTGLFGAHDVAEAPDGSIWVADNASARLVHLTETGDLIKVLDGPQYGFIGPRYLDMDEFGRLVVADQDAHRILLIDPEADALLGVLGDGAPGLGPNKFDDPEGVAVSGTRYYVSDSDNNRIVRYIVVLN